MAFPPDFLDEIRNRLPLSGVVGRRVRLIRRGREHTGLCPFHNEKTPSFTVSDDKGFYHCFGCGAHGDVIGFVMQTEGLSFPEAVERLAGEAGLEVPRSTPEDRAREQRRAGAMDALEMACDWFQRQLESPEGVSARDYLADRGLTSETIRLFRLGYAPNSRGLMRSALNAKGVNDNLLVEAGLAKRPEGGGELRDYFFDRIVFPITDRRGRVIAFGGRAMSPDAKAKYLNSPDSNVFHKGRVLYNLARARQAAHDSGEVVVCEGYMDVIALAQSGFPGAVAPLGTAVTEDQIAELWRLAAEPVLCLDGDAAGQRAGFRAAERALPLLRPGKSLSFAVLPEGEDPDSLVQSQGPKAFREVLSAALPLAEVLWRKSVAGARFDTPERRAALKAALLQDVDKIRDESVRSAYREEMLRRFGQAFGYRGTYSGGRGRGQKQYVRGGGGIGSTSRFGASSVGLAQRPPLSHLQKGTERGVLYALVNHPEIILDRAEDLAEAGFGTQDLDRLLRALLDYAADHPNLDRDSLRCHLCDLGFGRLLEGLESGGLEQGHGFFGRPEASPEEVAAGLDDFLTHRRGRGVE
jgi:DNA primase